MHALPNGKVASRYAPEVYAWRAQVQHAIEAVCAEQFTGPVEVLLGFELSRIASHYLPANGRRAEPELRADAPCHPTVAPDIDKLTRAVLDSCTDAGLWRDDAQVAVLHAAKRYTNTTPGVLITVRAL
jgi:Holliday junction resolvase RusA-like endonuclease